MYKQDYTGENLYRFSTQQERRDYVLQPGCPSSSSTKISKEDLIVLLDEICEEIYKKSYSFNLSNKEDFLINAHKHGSIDRLAQNLIMRKLKETISKIYGARQANRQRIVGFIKDYLENHCKIKSYHIVILRLDVRKFYPSVNRDYIFAQLKESAKLSEESLYLLNDILIKNAHGLPLGASVSAPLSEYAMELFDKEILRRRGVLYYQRYVDDIVVICNNEAIAESLWTEIPILLKKLKLELNRKKSKKIVFGQNIPAFFSSNGYIQNELNLLGYRISYIHKDLQVHMSDNKIKGLKTKIVASLVNWQKTHDFNLLCMRLKFLTGNCIFINTTDSVPTFSGIKHNYPHLTGEGKNVLAELDAFLHKWINSRHSAIGGSFTPTQRKTLAKFSFKGAYEKNIFHRFTPREMRDIKLIW